MASLRLNGAMASLRLNGAMASLRLNGAMASLRLNFWQKASFFFSETEVQRAALTSYFGMLCRATFTFLKGPCAGAAITHNFDENATVADMKHHLLHAHRAFDANSQALVMVWEQHALKLTNDAQKVATLGATFNITVNVIKKAMTAAAACAPPHAAAFSTPSFCAADPSPVQCAVSKTLSHGSQTDAEGLMTKLELSGGNGTDCASGKAARRSDIDAVGRAGGEVSICSANQISPLKGSQVPAAASAGCTLGSEAVANEEVPASDAAVPLLAPHAVPPAQPLALELRQGVRVVITGLQAKPEMNDCTGVICDSFNAQSGRWVVLIASSPPARGSFRPVNLKPIAPLNQATEWLDEYGRQCMKNVNYAVQCPKGHSLVPAAQQLQRSLLCRVCHRFVHPKLQCGVIGCCGGCKSLAPVNRICARLTHRAQVRCVRHLRRSSGPRLHRSCERRQRRHDNSGECVHCDRVL
jgi:hypothetical protein